MINRFKESLMRLTDSSELHPSSQNAPKILLAVSGGIDSMCMAHLFSRIYYENCAIATINFSLRGEESDGDEELVKNWAKEREIEYFTTTFDTNSYAKERALSTQMAARELRYSWFKELIKEHSFDHLAIAHNLNDSVETFFINLLRGSGIEGLTGIKERNGEIIRPLLGFSREEIVKFVIEEKIPFREDSSNRESDYSRNRIRNLVFPEFEVINPSYLTTIERGMANLAEVARVAERLYQERVGEFFDSDRGAISIEALKREGGGRFWLYKILTPYGFNSNQIRQIDEALTAQSGKEFHSSSHLLIKDRESLLLYTKGNQFSLAEGREEPEQKLVEELLIEPFDKERGKLEVEFKESSLRLSQYPKPTNLKYGSTSKQEQGGLFAQRVPEATQFLDAKKLKFPLKIRLWREGDRFRPLGMKGEKKVSDFLIDSKIDRGSKASIALLITADERVAAIIGYRIADQYKITSKTESVLEVTTN